MTRVALPLALLASALLASCQTMQTSSDSSAAANLSQIESVERTRFQAWIKGDAAAMDPMLSDDLLYCHSSGVCQNKKEIMASILSKQTEYRKMDIMSFKPRALGPDAVLINGKLNIVVFDKGKELNFQAVYTDAYAKRDGRWQLLSWQSTRSP
jgi:uncharacterized protein (TIGR02246 family)